jgi:hypothetical protein
VNDPWWSEDRVRDDAEPAPEPELVRSEEADVAAATSQSGVPASGEPETEEPAGAEPAPSDTTEAPAAPIPRRADRHRRDDWSADARRRGDAIPEGGGERYPWVGLALLVAGLVAGGIGLTSIAMALDRPGAAEVAENRWWLVVGGGLAVAWSSPWFLAPRGRRRMAIVLAVCTTIVLAVAAVAIVGLRD